MKTVKGKTMFQEYADWLAKDAGDRAIRYKVRFTKKLFMIERIEQNLAPTKKDNSK